MSPCHKDGKSCLNFMPLKTWTYFRGKWGWRSQEPSDITAKMYHVFHIVLKKPSQYYVHFLKKLLFLEYVNLTDFTKFQVGGSSLVQAQCWCYFVSLTSTYVFWDAIRCSLLYNWDFITSQLNELPVHFDNTLSNELLLNSETVLKCVYRW